MGIYVGAQLHGIDSARNIMVAEGCVLKAAKIQLLRDSPFIAWGFDGADVKDKEDMFYIWVRTECDGDPMPLMWAARKELRNQSEYLEDVFLQTLEGSDIKYGYDQRERMIFEVVEEHNDRMKAMINYTADDLAEWKPPAYTDILEEFERIP